MNILQTILFLNHFKIKSNTNTEVDFETNNLGYKLTQNRIQNTVTGDTLANLSDIPNKLKNVKFIETSSYALEEEENVDYLVFEFQGECIITQSSLSINQEVTILALDTLQIDRDNVIMYTPSGNANYTLPDGCGAKLIKLQTNVFWLMPFKN